MVETKETKNIKDEKKVEDPKKTEEKAKETSESKGASTQTIIIAVLSTVIVCLVIVFGVLLSTGVIKFGDSNTMAPSQIGDSTSNTATKPAENTEGGGSGTSTGTTSGGVTCYNDTRAQIYSLEFCLPKNFEEGSRAKDGAWTYNLVDDDGWAEVHAYFLSTSRTPTQFINYLSSSLKVVDQNYTVNGTTWVRAEAGDYMQAFATKSGDYLYAVFYSVKLDSDTTKEAWQMIPETLVITK